VTGSEGAAATAPGRATFVAEIEAATAAGLAAVMTGVEEQVCPGDGSRNRIPTGPRGGQPPVTGSKRAAAATATFVTAVEAAAAAGLSAVVTGVEEKLCRGDRGNAFHCTLRRGQHCN